MKKYMKSFFFIVIIVILLLFIPPLVEGFDECIVDTLVNLKLDVAEIKEDISKLNKNETSQDATSYLNNFSSQVTSQAQGISNSVSNTTTDITNSVQDIPGNLEGDSKQAYNELSSTMTDTLSDFK
jgi:predicted PurR-regulated permease PerM